jgi:hypothetical protein
MKKFLLLTIAFIAIATTSHAQITKGSVFLGGGISHSSSKSDGDIDYQHRQSATAITPAVGIAIKENTVMGLSLLYNHSNYEGASWRDSSYTNWYGGGVFIRKYFPIAKSLYLYGEPELNYRSTKYEAHNGIETKRKKGWNAGVSLSTGMSYAISGKFHIEAGLPAILSLSYLKEKGTSATTSTKYESFNFSSNLSSATPFYVGFRFVLSKGTRA